MTAAQHSRHTPCRLDTTVVRDGQERHSLLPATNLFREYNTQQRRNNVACPPADLHAPAYRYGHLHSAEHSDHVVAQARVRGAIPHAPRGCACATRVVLDPVCGRNMHLMWCFRMTEIQVRECPKSPSTAIHAYKTSAHIIMRALYM